MKPVTLVLAYFCCTVSLHAFSQTVVATEITERTNFTSTTNINENCYRHFSKRFAEVSNARWAKTENGYGAYFTDNGIQYDVRYNHKGQWRCTIKYLPVDLLNKNVARIVRNNYRHYNIFFAQQVSVSAGSVYFVKVEKGNEWKFLRVVSSTVEELGSYVKG